MRPAAPSTLARRFAALFANTALLAIAALAGSAGLAADASSAARPAMRTLAQQSAATLYGVEIIVFRASSVVATEDWEAVPAGAVSAPAPRAVAPPRRCCGCSPRATTGSAASRRP